MAESRPWRETSEENGLKVERTDRNLDWLADRIDAVVDRRIRITSDLAGQVDGLREAIDKLKAAHDYLRPRTCRKCGTEMERDGEIDGGWYCPECGGSVPDGAGEGADGGEVCPWTSDGQGGYDGCNLRAYSYLHDYCPSCGLPVKVVKSDYRRADEPTPPGIRIMTGAEVVEGNQETRRCSATNRSLRCVFPEGHDGPHLHAEPERPLTWWGGPIKDRIDDLLATPPKALNTPERCEDRYGDYICTLPAGHEGDHRDDREGTLGALCWSDDIPRPRQFDPPMKRDDNLVLFPSGPEGTWVDSRRIVAVDEVVIQTDLPEDQCSRDVRIFFDLTPSEPMCARVDGKEASDRLIAEIRAIMNEARI